ncbi:PAS domain S-box-containing protein [Belliella pelovolcani]|uniref:histidine kinase n=2 Tax=Belliella pelovolcani TaxID=529505 RepID=A0A1N7NAC9_9BACT|nr:PAS domain S-box-containing protein [Belliella pelovolcani]
MYQALFDISPIPSLIIRQESGIMKLIACNEAFCEWADCHDQNFDLWPIDSALSPHLESNQLEELGHLLDVVNERGKTRFYNFIKNSAQLEEFKIEIKKLSNENQDLALFIQPIHPSGNKLKSILNNIPTAIIDVGLDGKILGCNPITLDTLGSENYADILGVNILKFFHDHDRSVANEIIKSIDHFERLERELRIIDLKGNKKWLSITVTPLFNKEGKVISILSIAKDITDEKKALRALKREKELTQTLINNVPSLFFLFDQKGKLLKWNGYTETATGYSHQEFSNLPNVLDLILEEDRTKVQEAILKAYELGSYQVDAYLEHKTGAPTPYLFKAKPIIYRGQPCIIGTGVNISTRKEFEEALSDKNQALEAANQELNTFASMVSHDLKEPLRMVKSFMELLDKKYSDNLPEKAKQYIQISRDSAIKMQDLITEMLNHARLGYVDQARETFNPEVLIHEIKELHQAQIDEKNMNLTVHPLPMIEASRTSIKIVLQNLISNALKYSAEKATPEVEISGKDLEDYWEFTIKDNGPGIAKKDQELIFLLFTRTKASGKYQGIGMGLATCKKIIQQHGGHISVESALGQGAKFTFTIKKSPENFA